MTTDAFTGLANIARKKCLIMANVTRLHKDGWNPNQKYNYASASAVADLFRPMLAEVGLALFPSIVEWNQLPFETKGGTTGYKTKIRMDMTWIDIETGVSHVDVWWTEADDYQDKAFSKAATIGLKYFLLTTFMMSTGDSADDPDSGQTGGKKPRQSNVPVSNGNLPAQYQQKPATPPTAANNDSTGTQWFQDEPQRQKIMTATGLTMNALAKRLKKNPGDYASADAMVEAYNLLINP